MASWWGIHVRELCHDLWHLLMFAAVAWYHQERKTLKEVLEGTLERRHEHMNPFEEMLNVKQFVTDAMQTATDAEAAEKVLAPQFPQLVADLQRMKTDAMKILQINDIAAPMTSTTATGQIPPAPSAPKAA